MGRMACRHLGRWWGPLLVLWCFAGPAGAQEHTLWIGFDEDLEVDTGCAVEVADAAGAVTLQGLESVVEIRVDPPPADSASGTAAQVTGVWSAKCDSITDSSNPSWAAPRSIREEDSDWPVGVGLGVSGGDVVEAWIPSSELDLDAQLRVSLWSRSAGGHRDYLLTTDGGSSVYDLLYLPEPSSSWLLLLGFVLLVGLSARVRTPLGSRRACLTTTLVLFSLARAAWAITLSLDGEIGDWSGIDPLATDISGDSETADPSADLLAFYAVAEAEGLAIRVDVGDLQARVCDHAETPCYYVEASNGLDSNPGTEANPWATLSHAMSELAELAEEGLTGARVLVDDDSAQGDGLVETGRILVETDDTWIIGESNVRLHNRLDIASAGWEVYDEDLAIWRSSAGFNPSLSELAIERAWGSFEVGSAGEEYMLVPYPAYEALAADHFDHPGNTADDDEKPFIGPGIYWDEDGSVAGDMGRIYLRLRSAPLPEGWDPETVVPEEGPPQFDAVEAEAGWTLSDDPNDVEMKITLSGPWLQFNADGGRVQNLTLEFGSVRMGGGTTGSEVVDLTLDGPAYAQPIELYSGSSHHVFDGLVADQKLPPWVTWQDVKNIYEVALNQPVITFNPQGDEPDVIHHIEVLNSTFKNAHDGMEIQLDAYRHLSIHHNVFDIIQDDAIQLGSTSYGVEIHHNEMRAVGTGVSRHEVGANAHPGSKYIHHNFIDASTPKYYCRTFRSTGMYNSGNCDETTGARTLKAFGLHEHCATGTEEACADTDSEWGFDGDPRHYYNNTVVVKGEIIGVGLHGQEYPDQLPFDPPSLVFNNVFVQLDTLASFLRQSPKWVIKAPRVLIMDGNFYYRPSGAAPCTEGPFYMSGNLCEFGNADYGFRNFGSGNPEQLCEPSRKKENSEGRSELALQIPEAITGAWEFADSPKFDEIIEAAGLFDDSTESLDAENDYALLCNWFVDQGESVEAVDLTDLQGAYRITTDPGGEEAWSLNLDQALPGVDGNYRGHRECL